MKPKYRACIAEDHAIVREGLRAGVNGFALKTASRAELMLDVKSVLAGMFYISPAVSDKVIKGYVSGAKPNPAGSSMETLTQRERQLLKLIAEGYKNRQIAECLHLSIKTVENHRNNLMKKLDLHNSAEVTAYAIEKGLVNR